MAAADSSHYQDAKGALPGDEKLVFASDDESPVADWTEAEEDAIKRKYGLPFLDCPLIQYTRRVN